MVDVVDVIAADTVEHAVDPSDVIFLEIYEQLVLGRTGGDDQLRIGGNVLTEVGGKRRTAFCIHLMGVFTDKVVHRMFPPFLPSGLSVTNILPQASHFMAFLSHFMTLLLIFARNTLLSKHQNTNLKKDVGARRTAPLDVVERFQVGLSGKDAANPAQIWWKDEVGRPKATRGGIQWEIRARGWAARYSSRIWDLSTWVYICVVEISECPSISWMERRSAPPSSRWVANE